MSDEEVKHEIVIIRRGGHGGHDEHHGGVWKIAFADFMTAMMAFFLVMWLISANDKTRASVARYFNPVKLVDATTQPRGLHDSKKDESGITASPDSKAADEKDKPGKDEQAGAEAKADGKPDKDAKAEKDAKAAKAEKDGKPGKDGKPETPGARQTRLDSTLRDNPYVALAEIVATKEPAGAPKAPSAAVGRRGGEAFRDPFAPPAPAQPGTQEAREMLAAGDKAAEDSVTASTAPTSDSKPTDAKPADVKAADVKAADAAVTTVPATAPTDPAKAAVLAALKPSHDGRDGPQVDVKHTDEGLLVSFTDTSNFSMFATGSAVPARKVVLMMERVAKALKGLHGDVVVRGFTDSKPFKTGRYDNWHLSIDRAQVAHYMLVRGGLDDSRVGHVEGYADRNRRPDIDPSSPLNRRIEILLKEPS